MSDGQVKLAYNSAARVVRAEFDIETVLETEQPPMEMINRAKSKLESEVNQGSIDFYEMYHERFADVWQAIHSRFQGRPSKKRFDLLIGQGGRLINNIVVIPANTENGYCHLSFDAPTMEINNWRYEWVLLNVRKQLKEHNIPGEPNHTQIRGAWLRACEGEIIQNLSISELPSWEQAPDKPFKLIANKSRREIAIAIHDPKAFAAKEMLNQILVSSSEGVKKMSEKTGENYIFRKNDLTANIKAAMSGPEILGVDMPFMVLVGYAFKEAEQPQKPTDEPSLDIPQTKKKVKAKSKGEPYPGMGILDLAIDKDGMEAIITGWDTLVYADASFTPDEKWLKRELKRIGVKVDKESKNFAQTLVALTKKEDINGIILAQGTPAKAASKPYLHKSYLDVKESESGIDLRDAKTRSIVMPGDLVCEVRYKNKASKGLDVYGNTIEPPEGEALMIDLGEGIEMRKAGKYYAAVEGMPVFEDKAVSISEIYIHKGNINLKSGNIYFNGAARIEGNIEAGATVMVKGDLEIHGSVEAAFVRSGGNITVTGGITTTEKGRIQARGVLRADYIGNSIVVCGSDMLVNKAILNSNIISGGEIRLNRKDGTLAGGEISCRSDIKTAKLGFPKGDVTVVTCGLDWRAEMTLRIRKGRLIKLKNKNEEDRKAMRELIRKKAAQLTAKHKEQIETLKVNLQRQRNVMDILTEKIEEAEKMMNWDKEVVISCYETLSTNVDINIGGTKIPVLMEVAGVQVSARKSRDGYVRPLREEDEAC